MGRAPRPKPTRLAEKLAHIRQVLGLSQDDMLARLGFANTEGLFRSSISGYERGTREPPLPVLLSYARAANVLVEALIDDELDLPDKLPASPKSEGVKRTPTGLSKRQGGSGKQTR
jgi:transcriptional regulator with XRE-family HTH domain